MFPDRRSALRQPYTFQMRTRHLTWFDDSQLLRGESIVREGRARMRIAGAPGWWEGTLIATTDRMVFLPATEHPSGAHIALWMSDVRRAAAEGGCLRVTGPDGVSALIEPDAGMFGVPALIGATASSWRRTISALRGSARPGFVLARPGSAAG